MLFILQKPLFIAEHCSINSVNHLGEVVADLDPSSDTLSKIKLHRTKCTGLILNIISPCLLKELLTDLGDAFYSHIIDESTMIDATKVMCVMIRYFSKFHRKVRTKFYRLIELECGTADYMTTSLKTQLKKDGLKLERLLGIGVDGANAMVGAYNSVSSKLREQVPNVVTVKCLAHSLHLCAEHACDVLPKNLDFFVKQSHTWFSNSTDRNLQYQTLYKTICENCTPKKIAKLSGTRWLARSKAINTILDQWEVLDLHFKLRKTTDRGDGGFKAETLSQMYSCTENRLYLIFLASALKKVTALNTLFQSESAEPFKLLNDLKELFYSILQQIVVPLQLEKAGNLGTFKFQNYLMGADCMNFGYSSNTFSKNCDPKNVSYIKRRCRDFLIKLAAELQQRIPANMKTLEKICMFCPEIASSRNKCDITDVAVTFKNVCVDIDATVEQWNVLQRLNIEEKSSEQYWAKVVDEKDAGNNARFENISKLAMALLSLPFSNALVERAFSIVNIIKDKLRNNMAIKTADAVMRTRLLLLKMFVSENVYESDFQFEVLDAFSEIIDG